MLTEKYLKNINVERKKSERRGGRGAVRGAAERGAAADRGRTGPGGGPGVRGEPGPVLPGGPEDAGAASELGRAHTTHTRAAIPFVSGCVGAAPPPHPRPCVQHIHGRAEERGVTAQHCPVPKKGLWF